MRIVIYLAATAVLFGTTLSAFAEPKRRDAKSLDDQLLEDLAIDAEKPSTGRTPTKESMPAPKNAGGESEDGSAAAPGQPNKRTLDDELLDGLEGEDVSLSGKQANENPLARLNQRMKEVERRIADARSDEKTQRLEREISDDLSKLIAQLQRQCSQCKKPSSQSSRRQQTSLAKPGQSAGQQPSEKPSADSSARLKEKQTAKVDAARMQEMLKDVWGHLPPHLRQQMEQSANEEFLPKYELEIAEYFRSLVSGQRNKK